MSVGTRILSVEDDERIRTAVKLALEDEGWAVEEADTGEEALNAFQRQPSDVVLIDIMLPGIDGFDVCRAIRRVSDVPIVMVTARADTHDVVAGLEAGADDYLTKPFAPKELSARIRALLRRARSTDATATHLAAHSAALANITSTARCRLMCRLGLRKARPARTNRCWPGGAMWIRPCSSTSLSRTCIAGSGPALDKICGSRVCSPTWMVTRTAAARSLGRSRTIMTSGWTLPADPPMASTTR